MKRMLAVALMLATVGCIDVPAMNGLMDRLVPEPEAVYTQVELNHFEGQFAPDPDQDQDTLIEAVLDIAEDPLQFQQALQNLSWVEYTHKFELPQGARYLRVEITIDYMLIGGEQPEEGPAGTLDLTFRTPDGEVFCRDDREPPCYEIVYWRDNVTEIGPYSPPLPTVEGEWTITISGSGMEGVASQLYSGNYELVVQTEILQR
ncbi:MAG: hypothetical protein QF822_02570 [Candidatus Poseidoniia archaeon]|nr:hypothetical protein [Candidatus Poseidoniia archaeon]